MIDFTPFPKIPRLSRDMVITEKLDGTNVSIWIEERNGPVLDSERAVYSHGFPLVIQAGSRTRFITPNTKGNQTDHFGFAAWVRDNADELVKLGPGVHYGEWWGRGIQRGYCLDERRFSLFNTGRWSHHYGEFAAGAALADGTTVAPECCHVVPVITIGNFNTQRAGEALQKLRELGSLASPGFMDPEGITIFHTASRQYFKKTLKDDEKGKG